MYKVIDVYNAIDRTAPFSQAMDFDNVGLLVGDREQTVTKVLICLDITGEVLAEARQEGAQLIVAHHPVIFHGLKTVEASMPVHELIRLGISAICCHTNLDLCPALGVNRALGDALEIETLELVAGLPLFVGDLPREMAPAAFAAYIKERLGGRVAYSAALKTPIRRVALCSGGGGEYIYSLPKEAQAFVTGEARQDEWIEARRLGIPMFTAGHYETEKLFGPLLQAYLAKTCPGVEFYLSRREINPVLYI